MSKDKGKPNGKTIPPIAEVAEALAAVNERMTHGMMSEKEVVFVPRPRVLNWAPTEDITTFELARAVLVLIVAVGGGNAFDVLDKETAEVRRHFSEPDDDEGPPPNEPA